MLRARGSWRGKINPLEPSPQIGVPQCPKTLTKEAKAIWKAIIKVIAPGVLTKDNGPALARYCDASARFEKVSKFLDEKGEYYTVKDAAGKIRQVIPWPQVHIYNHLAAMLDRLEAKFGLTPADRTQVHLQVANCGDRNPEPIPVKPTSGPPVLRIAN